MPRCTPQFTNTFREVYCARLLDIMKTVTYSYAGSLTRDLTKNCLKLMIGLPTHEEVGVRFNVNQAFKLVTTAYNLKTN